MHTPVLHNPGEYGMEYEEITIPLFDGVKLKSWFIHSSGSNKLIIANHPIIFNRYGFLGYLTEYQAMVDFKVNFLPEYKHMHNVGYKIICYDKCNHDESENDDGYSCELGRYEWKASAVVKQWVDKHSKFSQMTVCLMSRYIGANAQYKALSDFLELFSNVKCMVSPQPAGVRTLVKSVPKLQN